MSLFWQVWGMRTFKYLSLVAGSIFYGVLMGLVVALCQEAGLELPPHTWVTLTATGTAFTFWGFDL